MEYRPRTRGLHKLRQVQWAQVDPLVQAWCTSGLCHNGEGAMATGSRGPRPGQAAPGAGRSAWHTCDMPLLTVTMQRGMEGLLSCSLQAGPGRPCGVPPGPALGRPRLTPSPLLALLGVPVVYLRCARGVPGDVPGSRDPTLGAPPRVEPLHRRSATPPTSTTTLPSPCCLQGAGGPQGQPAGAPGGLGAGSIGGEPWVRRRGRGRRLGSAAAAAGGGGGGGSGGQELRGVRGGGKGEGGRG